MPDVERSLPRGNQPGDDQREASRWDGLLRFLAWLIGGGLVLLLVRWLAAVLADKSYRDAVEFAWVR